MEIQDRNNILQQLLGAKSFGSSIMQAVSGNFADMLGSHKTEQETPIAFNGVKESLKATVREKTVVSYSDNKETQGSKEVVENKKTENGVKKANDKSDKKEPVKKETVKKGVVEGKQENIQDKEFVQNEDFVEAVIPFVPVVPVVDAAVTQEIMPVEGDVLIESASPDLSPVVEDVAVEEVVFDNRVVVEDIVATENVDMAEDVIDAENVVVPVANDKVAVEVKPIPETQDNMSVAEVQNVDDVNIVETAKVFENVVEENNVTLQDNKPELENSIEVAAQPVMVENKIVETPVVEEVENVVAAPLTAYATTENIETDDVVVDKDRAKTYGKTEAVVAGEDNELLLRQAEYLDKKVSSAGKVKVEVTVTEEKIAAPVMKDVLQNRFEVENMFRNLNEVDAQTVAKVDEKVVLADAPTVKSDAQLVTTSAQSVDNATVVNTAGQLVEETSTLSVNTSTVVASGKEAIAEISGGMKTEAFSRINESSSRDVFKGMGKEAVEQIKVNITKSAIKGIDTIDIQLKPEDLGKIQIKMHISKDGKVQAEIISGRQETLDMLQREVSGLAKAFDEAGYDTDSKSFSFSFQDDNQAGKQSDDDSGLLKFIGDALEQETETVAGNDNIYDPALGLNIRV